MSGAHIDVRATGRRNFISCWVSVSTNLYLGNLEKALSDSKPIKLNGKMHLKQ